MLSPRITTPAGTRSGLSSLYCPTGSSTVAPRGAAASMAACTASVSSTVESPTAPKQRTLRYRMPPSSQELLPLKPRGPCNPCGPCGPCAPSVPFTPSRPSLPSRPSSPTEPRGPCRSTHGPQPPSLAEVSFGASRRLVPFHCVATGAAGTPAGPRGPGCCATCCRSIHGPQVPSACCSRIEALVADHSCRARAVVEPGVVLGAGAGAGAAAAGTSASRASRNASKAMATEHRATRREQAVHRARRRSVRVDGAPGASPLRAISWRTLSGGGRPSTSDTEVDTFRVPFIVRYLHSTARKAISEQVSVGANPL